MKTKTRRAPKAGIADCRALLASLPKMSETMITFAKPLTSLLPDPPPPELLRNAMNIAMVAWNLPLYEKYGDPQAVGFRAIWNNLLATVPAEFGAILTKLIDARLRTLDTDPRMAVVEVVSGEGGEARVVASATLMELRGP